MTTYKKRAKLNQGKNNYHHAPRDPDGKVRGERVALGRDSLAARGKELEATVVETVLRLEMTAAGVA